MHKEKVNLFTVLFHMGDERCIHRSIHFARKVHKIDAFNFNIKKKSSLGSMPPDPPRGCQVHPPIKTCSHGQDTKYICTLFIWWPMSICFCFGGRAITVHVCTSHRCAIKQHYTPAMCVKTRDFTACFFKLKLRWCLCVGC